MNENANAAPSGNRTGVVGLILSVAGVCLCGLWLLTLPGLIISLVGLRKEPRTTAIVGTVFGAIGIVEFLILGPLLLGLMLPALSKARESARDTVTRNRINQAETSSSIFHTEHNRYPKSFEELEQSDYFLPSAKTDGWDNQMHFHGDGETPPTITSAGSDGVFDTEDDLTSDADGSERQGNGTE